VLIWTLRKYLCSLGSFRIEEKRPKTKKCSVPGFMDHKSSTFPISLNEVQEEVFGTNFIPFWNFLIPNTMPCIGGPLM